MPTPTRVSTPGASNANAYADVAWGDAYHDARLFATDWSGATTANKTVALIMATRLLDEMYIWSGYVVNATQYLLWPRVGMWYPSTYYVPSNVIPDLLKNATAEFARQLIVADRSLDSEVETQGLTSLSVSSISMAFKDGVRAKVVPDAVALLIPSAWGVVRSRGRGSVPLRRV